MLCAKAKNIASGISNHHLQTEHVMWFLIGIQNTMLRWRWRSWNWTTLGNNQISSGWYLHFSLTVTPLWRQQLDPKEHVLMKIFLKLRHFHQMNCIWIFIWNYNGNRHSFLSEMASNPCCTVLDHPGKLIHWLLLMPWLVASPCHQ